MSCNNCFNGCTEIVSDQCVRYTGIAIPELGINNGDTLAAVELAITTYLIDALDGSGINPIVDPEIICNVISKYFAECAGCDGLSLNELLTAMIKAICDLQVQINATNATIAALEDAYDVDCLSEVVSDSGTHDILQATIDKLCTMNTALTGIISLIPTLVTADNVNDYIAAYLATNPSSGLISNRMVPFAVVEYYGNKTGPGSPNFDSTGAGTGDWAKIYLCNGQNGTPDKRGVVGVGTTDGSMGGLDMPIRTNPGTVGNPTYVLNIPQGANTVTLNTSQIPSHTHVLTVNSAGDHAHFTTVAGSETINSDNSLYDGTTVGRYDFGLTSRAYNAGGDLFDYELTTTSGTVNSGKTNTTGAHTHTATAAVAGSGNSHINYQPSLPCYYIQYRP